MPRPGQLLEWEINCFFQRRVGLVWNHDIAKDGIADIIVYHDMGNKLSLFLYEDIIDHYGQSLSVYCVLYGDTKYWVESRLLRPVKI